MPCNRESVWNAMNTALKRVDCLSNARWTLNIFVSVSGKRKRKRGRLRKRRSQRRRGVCCLLSVERRAAQHWILFASSLVSPLQTLCRVGCSCSSQFTIHNGTFAHFPFRFLQIVYIHSLILIIWLSLEQFSDRIFGKRV